MNAGIRQGEELLTILNKFEKYKVVCELASEKQYLNLVLLTVRTIESQET